MNLWLAFLTAAIVLVIGGLLAWGYKAPK